jgi:uncharacterized membrane protein YfcA
MDFLNVVFPVSGVSTNIFVPPLVALVVSFFTSMGGLSGAFLILPFQVSVLGYVSPSVTATNFVYNIVGIPSGVLSYIREGKMNWPLALAITAGTLPGVFLGYYLRVLFLPDPARFKVFVGVVLLYVGGRILKDMLRPARARGAGGGQGGARPSVAAGRISLGRIWFGYAGTEYEVRTLPLFLLALGVGVVGGAYGIGGGAIIAPFCISVLGLPVYAVAGAALLGTFVTSAAGVTFYSLLPSGLHTGPDWLLGLLFGLGGVVGMYMGARAQKHVPARAIKGMLSLVILALALKYVLGALA